ncbi:MAG TPA: DUF3309 family protein [Permianibacter sp.]|nr:DUF3309 family protein [Permianibacter sp.]
MTLLLLLIIFVTLFLIAAAPAWPHARHWGYWPSGALAVILLVLIALLLTGLV